ncbi:MAG TPA: hypothetical protein VN436_14895 [Holophaga sp.]|nr:hypothetical protein [Holophaga sp.]
MNIRFLPLLPLATLVLLVGCQPPELTADQSMALRQAQTRQYPVPYPTAFQAAITYLQDNAYQIRQAAKDAAVISAYKSKDVSGGEKFWGAFWIGRAAKKGDAYDVTFTFDAIDELNTQVRVNITHGVFNLAGQSTDVQPVTDTMLYKGVLDALGLEAQRKHMANQMRAKQPPAPTVATAAP